MKTKLRIAIGLPSTGNIRIETAIALISLVNETKKNHKNVEFAYLYIVGSYIHENREIITLNAQKEDATHLMFIDTDMLFPNNGIVRLLERDKDIIGADYNKRQIPLEKIGKYDIHKYKNHEPFECEGLGMGFMLIKMSVFDKLARPWYFFKPGNADVDMMGEDFYFCEKAREKGINVYCDPELRIKHIGTMLF